MQFILTKTVETLHKTNLAVSISLFDTCTFYQHCPPSLLMGKEDRKKKKISGALHPSLPSCNIIFVINNWLIQGSEKG